MNYLNQLAKAHLGGNTVTLELTPDWLQRRSGYGGWQAALAVKAMRATLGDNDVPLRSLQVNFIAPVPLGEVTASAELLRWGKSVVQLEAHILVDGKVAFTALGVFGVSRPSAIMERPQAPTAQNAPESLLNLPHLEEATPAFLRHFHLRWAAGKPPYSGTDHANAQIFVRFLDANP